ncbi:hypothetical protein [Variovorax sp. J22R115]|uniref:hypothetical protein n=1 Tax=Variovorax sp. J22R115 TaxID=3053509 RepID=UPI002577CF13|nr:hypothetical protein [Variovorax sp. J22R115]MDM0052967.1 hypothetical protein [Variovorax sp. J22R115]
MIDKQHKEPSMASDDVKTASELAEEARQTGHDAVLAAHGYAQEGQRIGREAARSVRASLADAKETGSEALDTVRGLSNDARDLATDAIRSGRSSARDAVSAVGERARALGERVQHSKEACAGYIAEQPVRATLIAMASGAAAMTLMRHFLRARRGH